MTDISFNPTSQGSKGHQALGTGGSFWLPPKMKIEKFETNLEHFKGASKSLLGESSNKGSKSFPFSGNSSVKLFQKGQTAALTAERNPDKPSPEKPYPLAREVVASKNASIPRTGFSASSPLQQAGVVAYNSGQTESHSMVANPRAEFINSISFTTLPKKTSKKNSNDEFTSSPNGTKSATPFNLKDESLLQFFPNSTEDTLLQAKVLKTEELVNEVKGLIADTPFSCFHQNGIMRIAFTLENGSSVSVRIESVKDNLQICFISEDSQVLRSLSDKVNLSEDHFTETSFPLKFHFFNSYKQMDELLPLTSFNR